MTRYKAGRSKRKYQIHRIKPPSEKRKAEIVKTMERKPTQAEIDEAAEDGPKGTVAWGMEIDGNKWKKVGEKAKKK